MFLLEASHFAAILASRRVQISGRFKAALFDGHSVSITGGWPSLSSSQGAQVTVGFFVLEISRVGGTGLEIKPF